jgi:hypothetical protein
MFKGQLSYRDVVDMPYKKLVSLRDARVKRLTNEAKDLKQEQRNMEKESVRQQILRK